MSIGSSRGDVYAPELQMPSSEYFKRPCSVLVACDEEPFKDVIDWIGDDRLVFSIDFLDRDSNRMAALGAYVRFETPLPARTKVLAALTTGREADGDYV
jgi:hypothetical protein